MIVEVTRNQGRTWNRMSMNPNSPLANRMRKESPDENGQYYDEASGFIYRIIED